VLNVDKVYIIGGNLCAHHKNHPMLASKDQHKVGEQSADLVQLLKDVQMKRIYKHAISLSSNKCVFLNTSLGRKYHRILEDDNGGDAGTWKSNHKGPDVNTNKWLSCD
jgi:hypothetical protein